MPTLTITVQYRTPSLNVTKRQHWAKQHEEKLTAFRALLSALSDTGSIRSTLTTSPEASKTFSMASATLASYLATNRGASGSKRSKSKSLTSQKRKHSSK